MQRATGTAGMGAIALGAAAAAPQGTTNEMQAADEMHHENNSG